MVYLQCMKLSDLNLYAIGDTINLAGAVFMGTDVDKKSRCPNKLFLCMFPEDRGEATSGEHTPIFVQGRDSADMLDWTEHQIVTLDMNAEDWQTLIRQTDLLETEVLAKASDGTLAKVILRKSARHIEASAQWKVFKRDGYACRYCGNADCPLTVDHLVPFSQNGPSTEANMVAACKSCNKKRGDLSLAAWLDQPHYRRVSANLSDATRQANLALVATLDAIPRTKHIKSR